jgi:DNA-binding transcriptional ArsR family regulator
LRAINNWPNQQATPDNCHLQVDTRPKIHNNTVVDILGTIFLALSDPTRRAIIERLTQGPATVNELTEPFAISQQMVSKHIAYLIRANLVMKSKHGRESVCTLQPGAIKVVSDWALEYRRFWDERFDKLDAVLTDMKRTEARDD